MWKSFAKEFDKEMWIDLKFQVSRLEFGKHVFGSKSQALFTFLHIKAENLA